MRNRFDFGILLGLVFLCTTASSAAEEYFVSSAITAGSAPPLFRGGVRDSTLKFLNDVQVLDPIFFQTAQDVIVTGLNLAAGGARAERGLLGVASRTRQTAQGGLYLVNFYGAVVRSENVAEFSFDDIVISPVGGAPPPFVAATFRFAMDAFLPDPYAQGRLYDTALITNFPNEVFANLGTRIQLNVTLRSASGFYSGSGGGDITLQSGTTFVGNTSFFGPSGSGSLAGLVTLLENGSTVIVPVPFFGVPVNEPLTLTVRLLASTDAGFGFYQNGGAWESIAEVGLMNTLTFAPDFVATLPEGMTLDSVSADIVDNVWTPVPEPGVSLMIALGVLALGVRVAGTAPSH